MNKINEDYIVEYVREITPKTQGYLRDMEIYAEENHVPIIEPEVAQFLKVMLKIIKPKEILEIGTAIGYSALVMAEATKDSNITSLELREDMVKIANENIKIKNMEDRITVINGDAKILLKDMNQKYDFIFLDAAKGQYINFFNEAIKLLNDDGVIISDNVLFRGMVASDELVVRRKKTIVKRLRKYLVYINELEGYTSSLIPLGDGIAVTYREGQDFE